MKGMILAAGFGTRLRPLTWRTPKPLVPLCNRPLLGWAVESFLAAGIDSIVVNLHHLPEPIETYLRETYGATADLSFSLEQEILGTGGAIRRVRDLLAAEEAFFLVNGDTIQFPDYAALEDAVHHSGSIAALTLRHPPAHDRFTPVPRDPATGLIAGFGRGDGEPLMFAGSHAIHGRIFNYLPEKDVFGIVEDVYQPLIEGGRESVAGVINDGLWFDIGTPRRYLEASEGMLDAIAAGKVAPPAGSSLRDGSLIAESAVIGGNFERSVSGARCRIEGSVHGSILWDDCSIGPAVTLERCIVSSGVSLQRSVHLRDAVICADDPAIPDDIPRLEGLVVTEISR